MSKALAPIDEFRHTVTKMESQFKMALPKQIKTEKFARVLVTAVQQNPKLLSANRQSLFAASMRAAQEGLLPDGKEAAFVTFKDDVVFMPMVSGILKKVRNSGELSSITAQVVHEKDKFRYWVDSDGEHLEHEPLMFGERGKTIGVYALAKTKDGAVYIEVLTEKQVQDVRNVSRSKDSGPWNSAFADEMRKKTAIRRLSKRLPMSTDLESAIHSDDVLYNSAEPVENEKASHEDPKEDAQPKKKSSRLSKIIEAESRQVNSDVSEEANQEQEGDIPL